MQDCGKEEVVFFAMESPYSETIKDYVSISSAIAMNNRTEYKPFYSGGCAF